MEVRNAAIVWRGNTKKRQSRATRFVLIVHLVSTRTDQTCQRASHVHVGMPNRRPSKRRVFPASKENTTMMKVRQLANFAKQTPIPRTKTEPQNAVHVRAVVLPKKEVRNAAIVWRGNTKKPRAVAKRFVLHVYPAITRIHPI